MKKSTIKAVCTIALIVFSVVAVRAHSLYADIDTGFVIRPHVRVDNEPVTVTFDVHPVTVGRQLLVPLRTVMEAVGFTVEWQSPANTARATSQDFEIVISLDNDTMLVNGEKIRMTTPAQVINSRMMIPACAVYDAITMLVRWDDLNLIINVYTGNVPRLWSSPRTWPVNSTNWPENLPMHIPGSIILHPELRHNNIVDSSAPMQFRVAFYLIPLEFARLVDVDEWREWTENIGDDHAQTMLIMNFVEHFNISREDFDTVVSRMSEWHESMASDNTIRINDEDFELPNADIIFTFDNDIIRYFYRRE